MLRIEARQMFRSNGLIDDIVVFGKPEDYVLFSKLVRSAISSEASKTLDTDSSISIEVSSNSEAEDLFTSLQNEQNEYFSIQAWDDRNILRVIGCQAALTSLSDFLDVLSGRGEGYSYISEYSDQHSYSGVSPEWRLHVERGD